MLGQKSAVLNRLSLFIFSEREREGAREGEKHWCEREASVGCLSHAPNQEPIHHPGTYPHWEGTRDLSACGMLPTMLSHTSQGLKKYAFYAPLCGQLKNCLGSWSQLQHHSQHFVDSFICPYHVCLVSPLKITPNVLVWFSNHLLPMHILSQLVILLPILRRTLKSTDDFFS